MADVLDSGGGDQPVADPGWSEALAPIAQPSEPSPTEAPIDTSTIAPPVPQSEDGPPPSGRDLGITAQQAGAMLVPPIPSMPTTPDMGDLGAGTPPPSFTPGEVGRFLGPDQQGRMIGGTIDTGPGSVPGMLGQVLEPLNSSWSSFLGTATAFLSGQGGTLGSLADQKLALQGVQSPSPLDKASAIGEIAGEAMSKTEGPAAFAVQALNPWYFALGGPVTKSAGAVGDALLNAGVHPQVANLVESTIANWGVPYADKALNAAFVNGLTKAAAARVGQTVGDVRQAILDHPQLGAFAHDEGGSARIDFGLTGPEDPDPRKVAADLKAFIEERDSPTARREALGPNGGKTYTTNESGFTKGGSEAGAELPMSQSVGRAESSDLAALRGQNGMADAAAAHADLTDAMRRVNQINKDPLIQWGQLDPGEQLRQLAINHPELDLGEHLAAYRSATNPAEQHGILQSANAVIEKAAQMRAGTEGIPESSSGYYPLRPGQSATDLLSERAVQVERGKAAILRGQEAMGRPVVTPSSGPYDLAPNGRNPSLYDVVHGPTGRKANTRPLKESNAFALKKRMNESLVLTEGQTEMPGLPAKQTPTLTLENPTVSEEAARSSRGAGGEQQTLGGAPPPERPSMAEASKVFGTTADDRVAGVALQRPLRNALVERLTKADRHTIDGKVIAQAYGPEIDEMLTRAKIPLTDENRLALGNRLHEEAAVGATHAIGQGRSRLTLEPLGDESARASSRVDELLAEKYPHVIAGKTPADYYADRLSGVEKAPARETTVARATSVVKQPEEAAIAAAPPSEPVAAAAPAAPAPKAFAMPKRAAGMKPTYRQGSNDPSRITWENDRDRAIYSVTNRNGAISTSHQDVLDALKASGMDTSAIRARGQEIRAELSRQYRSVGAGEDLHIAAKTAEVPRPAVEPIAEPSALVEPKAEAEAEGAASPTEPTEQRPLAGGEEGQGELIPFGDRIGAQLDRNGDEKVIDGLLKDGGVDPADVAGGAPPPPRNPRAPRSPRGTPPPRPPDNGALAKIEGGVRVLKGAQTALSPAHFMGRHALPAVSFPDAYLAGPGGMVRGMRSTPLEADALTRQMQANLKDAGHSGVLMQNIHSGVVGGAEDTTSFVARNPMLNAVLTPVQRSSQGFVMGLNTVRYELAGSIDSWTGGAVDKGWMAPATAEDRAGIDRAINVFTGLGFAGEHMGAVGRGELRLASAFGPFSPQLLGARIKMLGYGAKGLADVLNDLRAGRPINPDAAVRARLGMGAVAGIGGMYGLRAAAGIALGGAAVGGLKSVLPNLNLVATNFGEVNMGQPSPVNSALSVAATQLGVGQSAYVDSKGKQSDVMLNPTESEAGLIRTGARIAVSIYDLATNQKNLAAMEGSAPSKPLGPQPGGAATVPSAGGREEKPLDVIGKALLSQLFSSPISYPLVQWLQGYAIEPLGPVTPMSVHAGLTGAGIQPPTVGGRPSAAKPLGPQPGRPGGAPSGGALPAGRPGATVAPRGVPVPVGGSTSTQPRQPR